MGLRLPLDSLTWTRRRRRSPSARRSTSRATAAATPGAVPTPARAGARASSRRAAHRALRRGARRRAARVPAADRPTLEHAVELVAVVEAAAADGRTSRRHRGLPAARRPAPAAARRHARPGRHRGQHPPARVVGRARRHRRRRSHAEARARRPRHREVRARRHAHRHRRRQPPDARRADAGRQPAAAAARPAAQPASRSGSTTRRSRTCSPGGSSARPARRRASTRAATRALYELEIAFAELDRLAAEVRRAVAGRPACCATCSSTSPATRTAPSSASTSSSARTPSAAGSGCSSCAASRCRRTRRWRSCRRCSCARSSRASGTSPTAAPLVRWGTELHDRFLLPWYVAADIADVVDDLQAPRLSRSTHAWLEPFLEFRFPRIGVGPRRRRDARAARPRSSRGTCSARRSPARARRATSTRRSSGCRCASTGSTADRHVVTCNGVAGAAAADRRRPARFVAGVRYRAWQPPSALHPTIGVHAPLVVRPRRPLERPLARRLHLPRRAPGRAGLRPRSRSTPTRPRPAGRAASARSATPRARSTPRRRDRRRRRVPSHAGPAAHAPAPAARSGPDHVTTSAMTAPAPTTGRSLSPAARLLRRDARRGGRAARALGLARGVARRARRRRAARRSGRGGAPARRATASPTTSTRVGAAPTSAGASIRCRARARQRRMGRQSRRGVIAASRAARTSSSTDLYGPRDLLRRGILPPELVFGHRASCAPCDGIRLPGDQQLFTLRGRPRPRRRTARYRAGRPHAGALGRRLCAREPDSSSRACFPSLYREPQVHRLAPFFRSLRVALQAVAPPRRRRSADRRAHPGPAERDRLRARRASRPTRLPARRGRRPHRPRRRRLDAVARPARAGRRHPAPRRRLVLRPARAAARLAARRTRARRGGARRQRLDRQHARLRRRSRTRRCSPFLPRLGRAPARRGRCGCRRADVVVRRRRTRARTCSPTSTSWSCKPDLREAPAARSTFGWELQRRRARRARAADRGPAAWTGSGRSRSRWHRRRP